MSDLVAFVTARLGEDEEQARLAAREGGEWTQVDPVRKPGRIGSLGGVVVWDEGEPDEHQAAHIARHDPARVLREVAARRRLIGEQTSDHAPIESIYGTACRTCVTWQDAPLAEGGETEFGIAIPQDWPCRVARAEAAKWADHAHFDPSWALSE